MGSRNRGTNAFKLCNPKFDVVHHVPHMNLGIECAAAVLLAVSQRKEEERERAQSRAALAMSRAEKAGSINAKKRLV